MRGIVDLFASYERLLIASRILARLRNQTFFSLAELNARIAELLSEMNDRQMRVYGASRRELFERLKRTALGPLPSGPFEYGERKDVRVNIDYHVEVDHHFYSVPHALRGELPNGWPARTSESNER